MIRRETAVEREMATHSSFLAWEIPWKRTEELGGLHSMDSQKSQTRLSDSRTTTYFFWRKKGSWANLNIKTSPWCPKGSNVQEYQAKEAVIVLIHWNILPKHMGMWSVWQWLLVQKTVSVLSEYPSPSKILYWENKMKFLEYPAY